MPAKSPKLILHLDLLHPQSNPEKIPVKLLRWLLSSGRLIFIFVEAIVLIAFLARFKLDADIASKKEEIDQKVPFIQSLKAYETIIRQTQLKITTLETFYSQDPNYTKLLDQIAQNTPLGVKLSNLSLTKDVSKINIQLSAQAQTNTDLIGFISALKKDSNFSSVNLSNITLDQNIINFTVTATAAGSQGKSL